MSEPLFQRGSSYQKHRPGYPDSLFEWLANQCQSTTLAIDLGCGTGQASRGLEPWFEQVIGADLSPAQLSAAPSSLTRYIASSASTLPLRDGCVDLITVAQAFHWFDREAFFDETKRCLVPGGIVALISYGLCEVEGFGSLIRDYHDGPLGPWWPANRWDLLENYPDARLPWETLPYPGSDLSCLWSVEEMLGYLDTWSALVNARRAGEDPLGNFSPLLRAHWGEGKRQIQWPLRVKAWRKSIQ